MSTSSNTTSFACMYAAIAVFLSPVAIVFGQAGPAPTSPKKVIDLGEYRIGQTLETDLVPMADDENTWFQIRLIDGISPASWMQIDAAGSVTSEGVLMPTDLGVYDPWSYLVLWDGFSGGNATAAVSFGGGNGARLGQLGSDWPGGRNDVGWNERSDSFWPNLVPGVYNIVVVGDSADFSQSPNPNWNVSTSFRGEGSVRLRIRSGEASHQYWNEAHHGIDAGDLPSTAQAVEGTGPVETIVATFPRRSRDMYKIQVCDPDKFRVAANMTTQGGAQLRGRLYLFDENGRGVLAIHNTNQSETVLTLPDDFALAPGNYFLAISSNCGGQGGTEFESVPYSNTNEAMWVFTQQANRPLPPNGTGAAQPIGHWGRQADCGSGNGPYFVRLSLSGVCFIDSRCEADFNDDGALNSQDFFDFLASFFNGCF